MVGRKGTNRVLFSEDLGLASEPQFNPFSFVPVQDPHSAVPAQHSKVTWSVCTDHPVIRLIGLLPGGPIKIDFSNTTLSGTCKRGRVREREASTICAIT